jgi:IclR family mhp operon transcriptional activator
MTDHHRSQDSKGQLSSLSRALHALALLNKQGALTVQQAARALELPRTTAYRVLDTLVAEGYAQKVPFSGEYRLTPKVLQLSSGLDSDGWLLHSATPLLFSRTQSLGIPFLVATRVGDGMVVRLSTDRAASTAVWHFAPGYRTPIIYAASGHVMLGLDHPDDCRATVQRCFSHRMPERPLPCGPDHLIEMIQVARREGFSHLVYDHEIEASLSVPIVVDGVARAALLMHYLRRSANRTRVIDEFVPLLSELSHDVSRHIDATRREVSSSLRQALMS